jgi:hypothetical protein
MPDGIAFVRYARDRIAMMKAILEHPGEQADRVLAVYREQELKKAQQDRRGRIMGGAVTAAVGVALGIMMSALSDRESGIWTIGLIPFAVCRDCHLRPFREDEVTWRVAAPVGDDHDVIGLPHARSVFDGLVREGTFSVRCPPRCRRLWRAIR